MSAKIIGMMLVGPESWCIGYSLSVALQWCDEVVVGFHAPDAETRSIVTRCASITGCVRIIDFYGPWDEMDFREQLLQAARAQGATHCAVIDADEALSADLLIDGIGRRQMIENCDDFPGSFPQYPMLCPWLEEVPEYVPEAEENSSWPARLKLLGAPSKFASMRIGVLFRDRPDLYYKPREDGYQFHRRTPYGLEDMQFDFGSIASGCFHWQYVSTRRLRIKSLWYKVVERERWPNRHSPARLNEIYDWACRIMPDRIESSDDTIAVTRPCLQELIAYGSDALRCLHPGRIPWQWSDLLTRLGGPPTAGLVDGCSFFIPEEKAELLRGLNRLGLISVRPGGAEAPGKFLASVSLNNPGLIGPGHDGIFE